MAAISVRVGAARDSSLSTAFEPLIEASKRAKRMLAQNAAASGDSVAKGVKKGADRAEAAFAELAKEIAGDGKKMMDPAIGAVDDFAKEAKKNFRQISADFAATAKSVSKDMDKLGSGGGGKGKNFGGKLREQAKEEARVAAQIGKSALSFGKRTASGVLSGEGVDMSLSSLVGKNVSLEKRSADIVNSGYIPGAAGANGQRQSVEAVSSQTMDVAKATATDTDSISEGLQKFVGLTGDLETGRSILKDMAVLAKASGSDMGDMGAAAANVAAQFEGMPNKAELTMLALRGLAAQGKVGAVEISDMATQMAKVAAAAGRFEGDQSDNMAFFSAMSQEARKHGGATTATMATTATAGFSDVFTKGARLKAFNDFDVKTQGAPGQLRNAKDILLDSLNAAATKNGGIKGGAFIGNLGKMYATQTSQRAVGGFSQLYAKTYNSTQGSEQQKLAAATAAVSMEIDDLSRASMGATEEMASFKTAMATTDAKAMELSLQLQESSKIVQGALDEVLYPAIEGAAKWFNLFTGTEAVKDDKDAVGSEIAGTNAGQAGRRALQTGKMSSEDLASLDKTIEDQKKSIKKERANAESSPTEELMGGLLSAPVIGDVWNMADRASGGKGTGAQDFAQSTYEKHQLAGQQAVRLSTQLDQLIQLQKDLNAHMKDGTLKVTDPKASPARVDHSGRTGGPGTPGFGAPPRGHK